MALTRKQKRNEWLATELERMEKKFKLSPLLSHQTRAENRRVEKRKRVQFRGKP